MFSHLTRAMLVVFFGSILKYVPSPTALDQKGCIYMSVGKINGISHSELGKICSRSADDYSFFSYFFPFLFKLGSFYWFLEATNFKTTLELFKKGFECLWTWLTKKLTEIFLKTCHFLPMFLLSSRALLWTPKRQSAKRPGKMRKCSLSKSF